MDSGAFTMVLLVQAVMTGPDATREPRDQRLVDLVAECIARMESEGEPALDELCEREPELAAQLRERIARLRANGMLEPSGLAEGVPERLGDFKLVRRVASGGMGVVYEARQLSMDRRVALKLVRPETLYFPGARERFRREIDAVARLSHPGIAQIYVCGEQGELPYFAMEFVEGASLADALADLAGRSPQTLRGEDLHACLRARAPGSSDSRGGERFEGDWPHTCARIVRDAANVVEYAHRAGVLHRDLKPGNVLVTPAGRVVVVDFGLAALEGASTLTRSGAQLGSLPYMAPEQLRGEQASIGPATDVYGLGVTLYELLALRRPFDADSATGFALAIAAGAPPALRQCNPAVSRDLETVVLCALEADLARRYATVAELASELSRVLSGRPVQARRLGSLGRAQRWIARKPARAFALIGGPLLAGVALWSTLASRREADSARVAQRIAREQFDLTLGAIDVVAQQGGEQPIEKLLELIDGAQRAFAALEAQVSDPHALDDERAKLLIRRAELLERIGRRSDAAQAFRAAADSARRMFESGGDAALWRTLAVDCLSQLGGVLQSQARWQEALEAFDEGRALGAAALETDPPDVLARRSWASVEINRAQLLRLAGELEEARAGFARALPEFRSQLESARDDAQLLDLTGIALAGAAFVEWRSGWDEAAFSLWREALEVLERAHALEPDQAHYADDLGTSAAHFGRSLLHRDQLELARPVLERSRALLEGLVARHPEFPDYRQRLAQTLDSCAWLARKSGDNELALATYRAALEHNRELVARYADTGLFAHDLAVTLTNCAALEHDLARFDDALAHYGEACQFYDASPQDVTPDGVLAEPAVWAYLGHAASAIEVGELELARRRLERAAQLERPTPEPWKELAKLWGRVAERAALAADSGGGPARDLALDSARKALELGWRDARALEEHADWAPLRAHPRFGELLSVAR